MKHQIKICHEALDKNICHEALDKNICHEALDKNICHEALDKNICHEALDKNICHEDKWKQKIGVNDTVSSEINVCTYYCEFLTTVQNASFTFN